MKELRDVLADALFGHVRHLSLNADEGDAALRSDLPEIEKVLLDSLPRLRTVRLITSASRPQPVVGHALSLAETARATGVELSVSISLKPAMDDQDSRWGVAGGLVSPAEVIKALQDKGLPLSVSCALSPQNCYVADDVLRWSEDSGVQECGFHLGTPAEGFHGDDVRQQPQFTPEQRFHLTMFFDKLARHPRVDLSRRLFYRSLLNQIAFGMPRRSACVWQTDGVTLDMRGHIGYCPPQSPVLGSALRRSAWQVFREGMPERRRIVRQHCGACLHDSPGRPSVGQIARRGMDIVVNQLERHRERVPLRPVTAQSIRPADRGAPSEWRRVLITGWYGTETAGDKAILAEVVHFIRTCSPGCQITVTTLDRKVSQQTELELAGLQGAVAVEMTKGDDPALIESCDAVIVGGGPLMEVSQMGCILRMFAEANRQRKARIVFGCGVGPLHSDGMRQITGNILRMTTAGFFRDEESRDYAQRLAPGNPLGCACDPALGFLQRWRKEHPRPSSRQDGTLRIATLLRANTNEFIAEQTGDQLRASNARAAQQIARALEMACDTHQAQADMLHMNAPWIGGDDRLFNRQVAGLVNGPKAIRVERSYLPLEGLLRSLHTADAAIAMRYHAHLFCMALGIPFLSIDYTGKQGKVSSLIKRIGYGQWSEGWDDIDEGRAADRLRKLVEERAHWSAHLHQQADRLAAELHETYCRVFGVAKGDSVHDD